MLLLFVLLYPYFSFVMATVTPEEAAQLVGRLNALGQNARSTEQIQGQVNALQALVNAQQRQIEELVVNLAQARTDMTTLVDQLKPAGQGPDFRERL